MPRERAGQMLVLVERPRSGGERTQVRVCGVKRDTQLVRVAPRLRQDEPSLDRGEGGGGKARGIRVAVQRAGGPHLLEPLADRLFPVTEARGEHASRVRVPLGELACEAADRASAGSVAQDLELDEFVEPPRDRTPRGQIL